MVKDDGGATTDEGEIETLITNYYKQLFHSNVGGRHNEVLQHVVPRVTAELNNMLQQEYTDEEIKKALDGIGDLKASGSDDMPSLFYKQFWHVVGEDVIREVKSFVQGRAMPEGWNNTVVVLIPKVPQPEHIKDLRPISLCTVIYKVASKVLSNRLKVILPEIVSLNQSAFVPGRLITDNVLLAYEFTHYMKTKRTGMDAYAAIKLDMSKAYNWVEWDFLKKIMERMGFASPWVQTIMKCITSVSYRIKINGDLSKTIILERGLRQGDPLSPYLFLLCAEGFSALLNAAEASGDLAGVKVC